MRLHEGKGKGKRGKGRERELQLTIDGRRWCGDLTPGPWKNPWRSTIGILSFPPFPVCSTYPGCTGAGSPMSSTTMSGASL